MTVTSSQITVTSTAQQIIASDNVRRDVLIHAKHKCYIGNEGVTVSNGFLLDNGDEFRMTVFEGDVLWVVGEADQTGTIYLCVSAQT